MARALAAALTPLLDDGDAVDEPAAEAYAEWLASTGLDGVLALGTTGEGFLLEEGERRRAVERFVGARLPVIAHCGARTTRETASLAAHAAEAGAAGVAVIAPPYFRLDDRALLEHLAAAAGACAPLAFYVYEFEQVSGYAVPLQLLEQLRERVSNLAGLKVSDSSWEQFRPYLIEGLDVFVGPEALIHRGLAAGAAGAVSGLASAFPEAVAAVVRDPTAEGAARLAELRAAIERLPRHAALKLAAARRSGVPIREDVRAPLRRLTEPERDELDAWLASS